VTRKLYLFSAEHVLYFKKNEKFSNGVDFHNVVSWVALLWLSSETIWNVVGLAGRDCLTRHNNDISVVTLNRLYFHVGCLLNVLTPQSAFPLIQIQRVCIAGLHDFLNRNRLDPGHDLSNLNNVTRFIATLKGAVRLPLSRESTTNEFVRILPWPELLVQISSRVCN
jgi:hypothetical protein